MDYIYSTHVAVPEETIRDICIDLMRNTMHECQGIDMDLDQNQLMLLQHKMDKVIDSMCHSNHVSVDGWHLTNEQVDEITSELHNHRKIPAIKAFRSATGGGLLESKDFICSFCSGSRYEAGPLAAMAFKVAFNR